MPRLPRLSPVGVPLHIIQRGNNRQACFNNDEDMAVYANWLYDYSVKYEVQGNKGTVYLIIRNPCHK